MSNNCSISKNKNVNIDISLIIDDSKTAKVTIDLNNADDNYLSSLCQELSNKFSFDEQVKNNVYLQLQNIINKIKKKQNSKKNIEETFNRLYYIDIEKRKKSIEKNYQLKKAQQQKELEKYTFKPLINDNYIKLSNRNKKFEERLYPNKNKKLIKEFNNYKQMMKKKIESTKENELKIISNNTLSPKCNLNINEKSPIKNINENNTSMNIKKNEEIIKLENESFNKLKSKKKKKFQNTKSTSSFVKIFEKIQNKKNYVKDLTEISSISGSGKKNEEKINMTNSAFFYSKPFKNNRLNFIKDKNNITKNLSIETDEQNEYTKFKRKISNIPNKEVEKDKDNIIFGLNISSDTDKLLILQSKGSIKNNKVDKNKDLKINNDEFTFKPKLNEMSKKITSKRKENKKEFLNRISTTKYLTDTNILMRKLQNKNRNSKIEKIKYNTTNKSSRMNTNNYINPKSNRLIENQQNEIIMNKINEIEKRKKISDNIYLKNSYQEIEKFKYNNLKNCFDILISDNEINYNSLTEKGITETLKNKVIIPACTMINEKNLDFNFHNFYIICKDILDNYLL